MSNVKDWKDRPQAVLPIWLLQFQGSGLTYADARPGNESDCHDDGGYGRDHGCDERQDAGDGDADSDNGANPYHRQGYYF